MKKKEVENKRKYDNETATLDWKRNVMRRWLMDEVTGPADSCMKCMNIIMNP